MELAATALAAGEAASIGAVAAEGAGMATAVGMADTAALGAGGWMTTVIPAGVTEAAAAGGIGSSTLTALQGGATVASLISSLFSGQAGASTAKWQATAAELEADNARIQAEQRANAIMRDYVKKVGDARVSYASAGLDISSGRDIEASLAGEAAQQTAIARAGGDVTAASKRAQAASYRMQGQTGLLAAISKAATTGASYGLDIAKRG